MHKDRTKDGEVLKSGDPGDGFGGVIGKTLAESTPWWRAPKAAPKGAPNIVVILLDDLGFSDLGCFGSEIATPNIDRLAARGLRFNNYTTVPMCTPARAAFMTGKNPHSVGCGWLTHNNPGYPGYQAGEISRDAPTIPEMLRDAGYSTYAVGKWHNTADYNLSAATDRAAWPLQRGFDRFYGFLGAETNYHAPGQLVEGNEPVQDDAYAEGYFAPDDFTDKAIGWLRAHRSSCPDKPFYLYYATNAPHTPLHAKPADMAKYKGLYAKGWQALREARFARQKELGVIGADWALPGRTPGVPDWNEVPEDQHALMALYMEIYAGLIDNADQNIGRVLDELEHLGVLDNTLVILTSDNGASSIGGPDGAANFAEKRVTMQESPELANKMMADGRMGAVETAPAYPVGWANACNTPFRFYKRTPMNGGIRVPMVVQWPAKITDAGAVRQEWVHVTDILPTLLDLLDTPYPGQFAGYRTRGLDGVSFREMLFDKRATTRRSSQHYELEGNRGYIAEGRWKIASLQPLGTKIDLDNWVLFDLETDPTEINNLAPQMPDKLREIIAVFEADAEANYVYPIENRGVKRALAVDPNRIDKLNQTHVFYPGTETAHGLLVSPLIADRDYEMAVSFTYAEGQEGVIFALGDISRGVAAFVIGGELVVHYNGGFIVKRDLRLPIKPGEQLLRISHKAKGRMQGEAKITLDTPAGAAEGTLNMSPTILRIIGEGLDIGLDRRLKVCVECEGRGTFAYPGRIDWLRIDPGPQAPGSFVNLAEELAQHDW
jgi:arylsulfatase A-like enzyme